MKERIEWLRKEITRHNELYHGNDIPEITDAEYDALVRELKQLESDYPEFFDVNSPTQKVGWRVSEKFSAVTHKNIMQSLNDVFELDEVRDFINKTNEKLEKEVKYVVEPKIDGLAISLEYVKGTFVRGSTRGDGTVGEDVTHNLMVIDTIPKKLEDKLEYLEVRGEVYMPFEAFEKLNKYGENFANPRNAAAGSLRQLDSEVVKKRSLAFIGFNIQECKGINLYSHVQGLDLLKNNGFTVPPLYYSSIDTEDIIAKIQEIGEKRENFELATDGAVVKVDSFADREVLGVTAKYPRWAVAFKYTAKQVKTKLTDIVLQIGRSGVLTPNAVLEPVDIAGSTVSRATLHNMELIEKKDIRIGDTVIVQKAGDIIPEVVSVCLDERRGNEKKFQMPSTCPFCKGDVVLDGVDYKCTNKECTAKIEREIQHFVSRAAMDIDGIGESLIKSLVEKRWVRKVSDLYTLRSVDLFTGIPGMKEKSAEKIVDNIEKSKNVGLARILFALGIRNLGANNAKIIAENYQTLDNIKKASKDDLTSLKGIGDSIFDALQEYFNDEENIKLIQELEGFGVSFVS